MKTILLTRGKVALVDDADFARVSQFKWYAGEKSGGRWYAQRFTQDEAGKKHVVYLHRFLLGVSDPNTLVDHKNGDGLDCQQDNIRLATRSQNQHNRSKESINTSGFKGVVKDKRRGHWIARIWKDNRAIHIGAFADAKDAALAYNQAALKLHGSFARLNEVAA